MSDNKKDVNVHIMHSMKGGCGKSTCALFKAIQIAFNQDIDDEKAHTLLIDADFKGSAMTEILFNRKNLLDNDSNEDGVKVEKLNEMTGISVKGLGKHHILAIPDDFEHYITFSDYLRDSSKHSVSDIICHSCSYEKVEKVKNVSIDAELGEGPSPEQTNYINGYIDFILSSASAESKDWFRYNDGKIPAGVYSWRMDALCRRVLDRGVVNEEGIGDYSDIVIDMSPGYDEYSDILLELLRGVAEEKKSVKLHYYAVTTEDIGHKALTKGNIEKMIKDNTKYKAFSSVNLVLSSVSTEDFKNLNDNERTNYQSWLEADGKLNGKLYENKYSDSYHKFCRKGAIGGFEQDINKVLENMAG